MSENLATWEALCRPPADALKRIGGGRLSGMTDINPQWRLQMMTEQFGPIGIGWYYEALDRWTEQGAPLPSVKPTELGELMCFVSINLYVMIEGQWSKPIYGVGGSKLIEKEKDHFYNSDEGYKMATTDALSVAMKELGVAADIYKGLWDGSKYRYIEPELDRVAARNAVASSSSEVFSGPAELPQEYPDFNALVSDHSGKKGINELRNVGVVARSKGWTQNELLVWIADHGIDLSDSGLQYSDFAKLNQRMREA